MRMGIDTGCSSMRQPIFTGTRRVTEKAKGTTVRTIMVKSITVKTIMLRVTVKTITIKIIMFIIFITHRSRARHTHRTPSSSASRPRARPHKHSSTTCSAKPEMQAATRTLFRRVLVRLDVSSNLAAISNVRAKAAVGEYYGVVR